MKFAQKQLFTSEKNETVANSRLARLGPFQEEEIIREGGRLNHSDFPWHKSCKDTTSKTTCIRVDNSSSSSLIRIVETYQVLAGIRQHHWIVDAVSAVKHVLSTCHVCKRQKAKLIPGQTANFSWVEPNTCTLNQVNEKFGVWINSESLFQYGTAQPFFLPTPAWNLDFESNLERLWFRRQTFMYRT